MPTYNFKKLQVVPTSADLIDAVLSKTQRGTPTVCHNGWSIQRIRQFYMRKVKFTQSNLHDRLTAMLDSFPKVDDVHPFYADLLNVLYDRDHYKLALGQLNSCTGMVDRIARDYVRLLKYGDSLYRCKQLKRAALGRMCTLLRKQAASLAYLEQVRQHMARLPSIDPNTRTLLVCGYPNVGKSSFVNRLTRAEVEVQPYAFTTKALYIGHTDYKYLRWQVIDTPGVLDRPLEERNTIEMQSITALAHLRAVVLYLVDISEQCGYTIRQQAALFHSIKPLFAGKPLLVVCNKTDVTRLEDLDAESRELVEGMRRAAAENAGGVAGAMGMVEGGDGGEEETLLQMSTLAEDNIAEVKQVACERLLAARVEQKLRARGATAGGGSALNRLHVAMPAGGSGGRGPRAPCIPAGVEAARARRDAGEKPRTEMDLQEERGGAGVYNMDLRKKYLLADKKWNYDIMPEIYNGHNVADFVDPDIEERLEELEREEEAEAAEWEEQKAALGKAALGEEALTEPERATLSSIRLKKQRAVKVHRLKKNTARNYPVMPRTAGERGRTTRKMRDSLGELGVDTAAAEERARERAAVRRGRSLTRKRVNRDGDTEIGEGGDGGSRGRSGSKRPKMMEKLHSSRSRSRSRSLAPERKRGSGLKNEEQRMKVQIMADKAQRKRNLNARKGEGDHHVPDWMPKHLYSGKRGNGKTDWR